MYKTVAEVIHINDNYDSVEAFSEDGLARVKLNNKMGYIDKTGKEVIPCIYDSIGDFENGRARVELDGNVGFINKTGKALFPFSENLVKLELNGKWGLVDKTGKDIIPCKYDSIGDFLENGLAHVKLNGKIGFINKTGKEVIPCKYDSVGDFSEDGLAEVTLNGRIGLIDKTGMEVISVSLETIKICGNDNSYYTFIYKDSRPNDVPEAIYNGLWGVQKEVIDHFTYYDIDKLYAKYGETPKMTTKKDFYKYGKGVCRHYVKFFYILAHERSLTKNLHVVAGDPKKGEIGHTWLEYRTEKNIYIIDPTWSGDWSIPNNVARLRFIKSKAYGKHAFFITYSESKIIFGESENHSSFQVDFVERIYIDGESVYDMKNRLYDELKRGKLSLHEYNVKLDYDNVKAEIPLEPRK